VELEGRKVGAASHQERVGRGKKKMLEKREKMREINHNQKGGEPRKKRKKWDGGGRSGERKKKP